MTKILNKPGLYAALLITFIALGVGINIKQQMDVDKTRLSEKVELSKGFQRWITNMKNKDFDIDADEFLLIDENEVFNSKTIIIARSDEIEKMTELEKTLEELAKEKRVAFSPSKKGLLDYREVDRAWFLPNQVRFYGLKEDKILDFKALECALNTNCYIDRGFFIDNDTFAVVEISRNVDKRDPNITPCTESEICEYTVKLHVTDMVRNSRSVYVSKPFNESLAGIRDRL